MKKLKFAVLALLAVGFVTSCSDDDETPAITSDGSPAHPSALVICQGNQGNKIAGSIDMYSFQTGKYYTDVFAPVNGSALGYGPQNATISKGKIFVALFDENMVSVFDRTTLLKTADLPTPSPEFVLAEGNNVYVACNDGFVTRINAASLDTARLYVGPNPMGLAVSSGYLYASVSDAYNYMNNYQDGKRVAKIKMADFTVEKYVAVGLNPTSLAADGSGNVFVACQGNYADVAAEIWKISDDSAAKFADGSILAAKGNTVYVINSVTDWSNWPEVSTVNDYAAYDSNDGTRQENFKLSNAPSAPVSITADPKDNRLYITADAAPGDYSSAGRLYVCSATDGSFVEQFTTGIHPFAVVFNR